MVSAQECSGPRSEMPPFRSSRTGDGGALRSDGSVSPMNRRSDRRESVLFGDRLLLPVSDVEPLRARPPSISPGFACGGRPVLDGRRWTLTSPLRSVLLTSSEGRMSNGCGPCEKCQGTQIFFTESVVRGWRCDTCNRAVLDARVPGKCDACGAVKITKQVLRIGPTCFCQRCRAFAGPVSGDFDVPTIDELSLWS